ncbi:alpha/beta hydrolase [Cronbergia sp. UHCC 0137]|uniref:alpha/beta hydrolase n=1 Tax=Cronbergia sp. UHCC 0137 TaxID=3110239 RepID=UPI002B1FAB49|nr:alpha/beta hydrolase [Cronbergia sp. UHCC 0137]MEA5616694.1 alpha/beta hydrolase [Cronbergia sp. UHCC 0137]
MNSLFGNWCRSFRRNSLLLVLIILLPIMGISNPVMAAEGIYASYSALGFSIPVTTLEKYVKTGVMDGDLAIYEPYFPQQKLQELRQILLEPVKVSPKVAAQFLYTQQGEFLLRRLAELIKTKSSQLESEFRVLRTAMISAAGEPEGLTLLSLLRKYPGSIIRIDLAHSLEIIGEVEKLIRETNQAIALVMQKSNIEATTISLENLSRLPDLDAGGKFRSQKYTIKLSDWTRNRLLLTDVYVPDVQTPAPVIVISHGLGLDSSNFRYLANHLVGHGFGVIVPNHPPKNSLANTPVSHGSMIQVSAPNEFIDRPLDIKFILNQLEKKQQSDVRFRGRLNLQQVGVFGQSLGGYTALALAGAKINFQQLEQDCQPTALQNTWNMSLLLQCQALELKNKSRKYDKLGDKRVKAAIAVNPITSSIFGKTGISQVKIPVMIVGSSEDTVAPALSEQILPFSWVTHPQKYLVMMIGGTHFSTIGNSSSRTQQVPLPTQMVGDADQARRYINTLSLPFFQAYVVGRSKYISYLNAGYAKIISCQSLGLSIVQSLTRQELTPIIGNGLKQSNFITKKIPFLIVRLGCLILYFTGSLLDLMRFF